MIEIIPSVLTSDSGELGVLLRQVVEAEIERVHVDIIDTTFAANQTVLPEAMEEVDIAGVKVDYHLMVDNPINWIERSIRGQADRIIGQIEHMPDQEGFVKRVLDYGLAAGVAVDLATEVGKINPVVFALVDTVLVMSVKAGFGGQEFHPEALKKLAELATMREREKYSFKICDDGGITFDKIDDVVREGVDEVVIGRRLFEGDIKVNMEKFLSSAYQES